MSTAMRRRVGLSVANAQDDDDAENDPFQSDSDVSEADEPAMMTGKGTSQSQKGSTNSKSHQSATEDFPSLQQSRPKNAAAQSSSHTRLENDNAVYAVPGYTSIVFDAQLLLHGYQLVQSMLQSKRWIVVIPLAVITELDRLAKPGSSEDPSKASTVLASLEQLVKTHNSVLKIQTSRGNYLRDLSLRAEDLEYANSGSGTSNSAQHSHSKIPRGLDDVIVAAGKWQIDNWLDRRQLLLPGVLSAEERTKKLEGKWKDAKVLLVSDNKILRAQGRAKGLNVASYQELEKAIQADPPTNHADT